MIFRFHKLFHACWMASAMFAGMMPAYAHPKCRQEDGSINLTLHETGVVVGYGSGQGVFTEGTHHYPVEIKGGGLLTFGNATLQATACVTNLNRLSDLAGTYWTIGGAASITNGIFVADMENARGVDMHVQAQVHGPLIAGQVARFSLQFMSNNRPDI
ncbi:hypothetical protein [Acetobacter pasteurianus]|nr:hypothetical protein [Acetobacter pasteurianus]